MVLQVSKEQRAIIEFQQRLENVVPRLYSDLHRSPTTQWSSGHNYRAAVHFQAHGKSWVLVFERWGLYLHCNGASTSTKISSDRDAFAALVGLA